MPRPGWKMQKGTSTRGPFSSAPSGKQGALAFFPNPNVFLPQTMDIYTGNGAVPPPGSGTPRIVAVNIYISGVWMEGHRTKVTAQDAYTHLILCDPGVSIIDPYHGNSQSLSQAFDTLAIPAGQTNNWWFVRMVVITNVPGFGRRKLICADRFGLPGSWTTLV